MDSPEDIYRWACDLFPICRSISGEGVRTTLAYLQQLLPGLQVKGAASGEKAFDWTVPDEWNIEDAFVADAAGNRVIDFRDCNLHLLGYSEPVDVTMSLDDLQAYLHSIPEQPDAIPYLTSYYRRRWGFCLSENQRKALEPGQYRAVIKARLEPGIVNYGELLIPGDTEEEVLFSTYVCHPSMGNNELSGVVVTTAIARAVANRKNRRYGYRFLFLPETIGSLIYLSRHLPELKRRLVAGFVVTCVGDERAYSYLSSRLGDNLADRVAVHVLDNLVDTYKRYSFLERGSDERQFCAPGIDLPVASIMRSKYDEYPEYHTSLDDLSLITATGLGQSAALFARCIDVLEGNHVYVATTLGEPQLGKRGLYPNLSTKDTFREVGDMLNVLAYSDGTKDIIDLAETIRVPAWRAIEIAERLEEAGLLRRQAPSCIDPAA